MAVDTKHPLFAEFDQDWQQMRDTYRGERIVKRAGFKYLPATSGMVQDGITGTSQPGFQAYAAYRTRARYPGLVKESVEAVLGVMHNKPPTIDLPAKLEPLREKFSLRGESIGMFLRRLNEEQLVTGRAGILLDVPDGPPPTGQPVLPLAALYRAEHIINWDEGEVDQTRPDSLNMVVIDESEEVRQDGFDWSQVKKFRVLVKGDLNANEQQGEGVYQVGVFRDGAEFTQEGLVTPSVSGKTLNRIPFQFVNTKDVTPTPDEAPLLELSNLTLTIYRGEADYRQALYMQGQDTFVITGNSAPDEGEETRMGAGAVLNLPMGATAQYEGVNSEGITEMREALVNDYASGRDKAGSLLEAISRSAESGEALRVRVAAKTASLNQIALASAFAVEQILKTAAEWVGANPDEVVVTPNLDFVDDIMSGQELAQIMAAKGLGAPLSLESIHKNAAARGMTEMTFDEEIEAMAKEGEEGMPGADLPGGEEDESDTANPDDEGNDAFGGDDDKAKDDEEDEEEDDN